MREELFSPSAVGFLLTFKCNISCRHCLFECSPERDELMPLEDALNYVREISNIEGIKGIVITGGEPFLYYDQLKEIISSASKAGLITKVITNAFWAKDKDGSKRKLSPLVTAGLRAIDISFDDFHAEYIPKHKVQLAAETALDYGLTVAIAGVTFGDEITEFAVRLPKEFDTSEIHQAKKAEKNPEGKKLSFIAGPICHVGNAENLPRFLSPGIAVRRDLPCRAIIKSPIILPNGDVAACCGVGAANRKGFYHRFIAGNAKQEAISDIFNRMGNDLFYNMIFINGPYQLLKLGKNVSSVKRNYSSLCAMCREIVNNPQILAEIEKSLPALNNKLKIQKLYLKAIYYESGKKLRGLKMCRAPL